MDWTALIPLKLGPDRKSRLSPYLSADSRMALGSHLADIVLAQVHRVRAIARVLVLAPEDVTTLQEEWVRDAGRGLNAELAGATRGLAGPLLVIHGDLPFVRAEEIALLLAQAEQAGGALAPDRHGTGTNALALVSAAGRFPFAFGQASLACHRTAMGDCAVTVTCDGLGHDLDTPDDLDLARLRGFAF